MWEVSVSPAHLLDEVLSVAADVIHTVLVHREVCLKSFVFLQQALQWKKKGRWLKAWHGLVGRPSCGSEGTRAGQRLPSGAAQSSWGLTSVGNHEGAKTWRQQG